MGERVVEYCYLKLKPLSQSIVVFVALEFFQFMVSQERQLRAAFSRIDRNQDGMGMECVLLVNLSLLAQCAGFLSLSSAPRCNWPFAAGKINARELAEAFRELGLRMSESEAEKMIGRLDRDGTLSIDFREFFDFFLFSTANVRSLLRQWRKSTVCASRELLLRTSQSLRHADMFANANATHAVSVSRDLRSFAPRVRVRVRVAIAVAVGTRLRSVPLHVLVLAAPAVYSC